MSRLEGKVAIVTGGARGIGQAIAKGLAADGARVVIADLQGAEEAATAYPDGVGLRVDVASEEDVARMADEAVERCGGIDVLVNNAGLYATLAMRPFDQIPVDEWRKVMDVNVLSMFLTSRAVVPHMREQGGGRIVNISMNEQTMVRRGFVPYGPAGAGVEALSRVMAADLAGSTVTVNILLPGGWGTRTGMVPDDAPAEVRARLLDPAVMGPPIVWLASERATGVHDRRIVANEFDAASAAP